MIETAIPVKIDQELCDGCGRCVHVCMMNVIEMQETQNGLKAVVTNADNCMFCEACVIDCRKVAIMLNPVKMNKNIKNISESILNKAEEKTPGRKKSFLNMFSKK